MSVPASQAAPLTRQDFVAQLERAAKVDLPVTSALLRTLAEVLKQAEPSWWTKTMKAWERRRFTAWNEAWGVFLTAVHYEALRDPENPLVQYFPSCGGTPEVDPSRALLRFLNEAEDSFYERLRNGHRRHYVGERAAMWIPAAVAYFQAYSKQGLPFYLVQMDAGAGLDLAPFAEAGVKSMNQDLILARIGLDPEPLAIEDLNHRRWLTAGVLPDYVAGIQELDRAADYLLEKKRKDPTFVQLAPCAAELAPAFIAKNVPVEQDAGLMLINMGATCRLNDLEYQAYATEVAGLLADWGGRGFWLEVEPVRGELYSTTQQMRAHKLIGGKLQSFVGSSFDTASGKVVMNMKGFFDFLQTPA